MNYNRKTTAILLAGGKGTRMLSEVPKQFLFLGEKPCALYSFHTLCSIDEISEIIVVCESEYRHFFSSSKHHIIFADPGKERQDSTFNGLMSSQQTNPYILVHDSARPFITQKDINKLYIGIENFQGCALATPITSTVKKVSKKKIVEETLPRDSLFAIQTPQLLNHNSLIRAFEFVKRNTINVTDELSLLEAIHEKVNIVIGNRDNIKLTTPEDMEWALWKIEKNSFVIS